MLDDVLDIAQAEGALSLLFIMETPHRRVPVAGVVGRLRTDPKRAIGELTVMKDQLLKLAARRAEFGETGY